jgi:PIF1-like helicase
LVSVNMDDDVPKENGLSPAPASNSRRQFARFNSVREHRRSLTRLYSRSLNQFKDVLSRSNGTVLAGACYWLRLALIRCVPVNQVNEEILARFQSVTVNRHSNQVYFAIGTSDVVPPLISDLRFRLDDDESCPDALRDRLLMANASPSTLSYHNSAHGTEEVGQTPLDRPSLHFHSSSPVPLNLSQPETLSRQRPWSETSASVTTAVDFTSWYGADLTAWPIQMRQGQGEFYRWTLSWLYCALLSEAHHGIVGRFPFVDGFLSARQLSGADWLTCVQAVTSALLRIQPPLPRTPPQRHWSTLEQETAIDLAFGIQPSMTEALTRLFQSLHGIVDLEYLRCAGTISSSMSAIVQSEPAPNVVVSNEPVALPPRRSSRLAPVLDQRRLEEAARIAQRDHDREIRASRAQARVERQENDLALDALSALYAEVMDAGRPEFLVSPTTFEEQPAVRQFTASMHQFIKSLNVATCVKCHEACLASPSEDGNDNHVCVLCKSKKNREHLFSQDGVVPTLFRYRKAFLAQFHEQVGPASTSGEKRRVAMSIPSSIPLSPENPLRDIFEDLSPAERSLITGVRMYAFIYRVGDGYAGTKGVAVAFPGKDPALHEIMRLPNLQSPFIIVSYQRKDLSYTTNRDDRNRQIRIPVMQRLFQFVRTLPAFSSLFDDEALERFFHVYARDRASTVQLEPLITLHVPRAVAQTRQVTEQEVASIVADSQRSGRAPAVIEVPLVDPSVAANDATANNLDEAEDGLVHNAFPVDPGEQLTENGDDAEALHLPPEAVLSVLPEQVVDEARDLEANDSEEDVAMETHMDQHHPPETMTMDHTEGGIESIYESASIQREAIHESIAERIEHAGLVSSPQPQAVIRDAPVIQIGRIRYDSPPVKMTDPQFWILAFPDIFIDTNGVPQFKTHNATLQAAYPVLRRQVDPSDQIQHLMRLAYRDTEGLLCFPVQSCIVILAVFRQILERRRISQRVAFIYKDVTLSTDEIIRRLREPGGLEWLTSHAQRSQAPTIGDAAYLREKLRFANEVNFQCKHANMFLTLSFADFHHSTLLRLLGINPESSFESRRKHVASVPGFGVETFLALKEHFVTKFVDEVLGCDWAVIRDEFQARFSIHSHALLAIKGLDFTAAVAGYVQGNAARHLLFKRVKTFVHDVHRGGLDRSASPEQYMELLERYRDHPDYHGALRLAVYNEKWKAVGDPLLEDLQRLESSELEDRALNGEQMGLVLCRVQDLFISAFHPGLPSVDPSSDGSMLVRFQHARAAMKELQTIHRTSAEPMDVVTWVLNHDPECADLPPEQRAMWIAERCMVHECRDDYCYNTAERKKTKQCRFGGSKMLQAQSSIELQFHGGLLPSVNVSPARNHPDLVAFNRVMLASWGANCDLKLIFDQARVLYYMLKYTLKKDKSAAELSKLVSSVQTSGAQVDCSADAGSLVQRLMSGDFASGAQFIKAVVGKTSFKRELGAPELCFVLFSQPMVQFRHIRLTHIPALVNSTRIEFGDGEDGHSGQRGGDGQGRVTVKPSIWAKYIDRMALVEETEQVELSKLSRAARAALKNMSMSDFVAKYYVSSSGIVLEHKPSTQFHRVFIWPYHCNINERKPDSEHYWKWALWFMLRFVAFTCPSNVGPKGYLRAFVDEACGHDATLASDVRGLNLEDESLPAVQDIIVRVFKVLAEHNEEARDVYLLKINRYEVVERVTDDIRQDGRAVAVSDNGAANDDIPLNPVRIVDGDASQGESVLAGDQHDGGGDDDEFDGVVPSELLVTAKSEVVPVALQGLLPDVLNKIAVSGAKHLAQRQSDERFTINYPVVCQPLNDEQSVAFNLATYAESLGGGIFIHGGPGSGKSNVIRHLLNHWRSSVLVTATTGKAAFLVFGDTMHAVFKIMSDDALTDVQTRQIRESLRGVKAIIVDEASMLGTMLLRRLYENLKTIAPLDPNKPWGGYRMIFVGDFGQCPPVRCGSPMHADELFSDFEVALLTRSLRTADPVSDRILRAIRERSMTPELAAEIRSLSCASLQPERAAQFESDESIFHLVTTNKEVDEINSEYIANFARRNNVKIARIKPRTGKELRVSIGVRLCVLQNLHKSCGITNGLFVKCFGVLYGANEVNQLQGAASTPLCVLVEAPDVPGRSLDTRWKRSVGVILRECGSREVIRDSSESPYRPLQDDDIERILASLGRVVPIGEVSKCEEADTISQMKWTQSFPLRLARAVTVFKLQGDSLDRLILTPGARRMFGTTYTGITRARGGFNSIVLAGNYSDEYLVDDLNAYPSEELDLVAVSERLARMAARSDERSVLGTLYTGAPLTVTSSVRIGFGRTRGADPQRDVRGGGRGTTDRRGRGRAQPTGRVYRGRGSRGSRGVSSSGDRGRRASGGRARRGSIARGL